MPLAFCGPSSIHCLLTLLAPLVWDPISERYRFLRPIEPTDWARFYKYNARVHALLFFREELHQCVHDSISARHRPFVSLPNLRRLIGDADPQWIRLVSHTSIRTLHLEPAELASENSIKGLLPDIPLQMPKLVDLDLDLDFSNGISRPDHRLVADMLKHLPSLQCLRIPSSFLLPQATRVLSEHQLLEPLTTYPETAMDATFSTDLNSQSFPSLNDLCLSIDLPRANSCLSSPFAPKTLKTISIQSQPRGVESDSGGVVDRLIKNIAHNWPLVESIEISANHRINANELTYLSIKPLLSCTQLTSITLEWPHPPCLTDAEFVAIFKKLPFLQVLDIGHGDANSHPPRMSMDSLISITPYCPHLAHLSVFMSFHALQDLNKVSTCSTTLAALRVLDVRCFPIEEPFMVALFLSRVLTERCVVRYGRGRNFDKWKQVASTLPLLWATRRNDALQGLNHPLASE